MEFVIIVGSVLITILLILGVFWVIIPDNK